MTDSPEARQIAALYRELLAAWNAREAGTFAGLFREDALVVGFDGSQMTGRAEIEPTLRNIFSNHLTASYVSKIRSIRHLGPDVAILQAVVGMVPPGKSELNPAVNAIQTLVAYRTNGRWQIESFQNTPAAFHGRPELSRQLTEELSEALRASV